MVDTIDAATEAAMVKRDVLAYWRQGPLNAPVMVASLAGPRQFWARGRVTCRKHLVGRTLPDVERILGLAAGELAGGACVYQLVREPTVDEFDLCGDPHAPFSVASQWRIRDDAFIPVRLVASVDPGKVIP